MANKENNEKKRVSNVYNISSKISTKKAALTPQEKRKRKRITRVSLFGAGFLAVVAGIVLLLAQLIFNVSTITVIYKNGSNDPKYYSKKEIIANSTIQEGDGLLFVSSSKVSQALEKNLPYISSVNVKKNFPSEVVIEVTECKKIYCFSGDSGYYLVNESGKVLEKTNEESMTKYTSVKCKSITSDVVGENIELGKDTDDILSYLELVAKSGMNITSFDFTDIEDVYMTYENRIVIHIGKMSDEKNGVTAWKKLQLAKKSLDAEDEINPEQEGTLNMTIPKKAFFKAKSELPEE
ncbi:MAG: FtsQ-type POTRA domain-containing protein [Ruminococcaceae bacterium]|nr:FtsQ-type POTRA domain-containing protein [Oscillospiraceae bacterium]